MYRLNISRSFFFGRHASRWVASRASFVGRGDGGSASAERDFVARRHLVAYFLETPPRETSFERSAFLSFDPKLERFRGTNAFLFSL
jgi:hypothetical protein